MCAMVLWLLLFSYLCYGVVSTPVLSVKNSFKPPYNSAGARRVAFWDTNGGTVVKDNFIQLTPNEGGVQGSLWNAKLNTLQDWEVVMGFVIGKPTNLVGADGMALWYTKTQGASGPVFGSEDNWQGMGLFFDSFDNDGDGQNPSVYMILNDGSLSFPHGQDGNPYIKARCTFNYRTSNYDGQYAAPTYVKVRYEAGVLSVSYDRNTVDSKGSEWSPCFSLPVELPRQGYFGLSAATGGITDYHDVISFQTYKITPQNEKPQSEFQEQEQPEPVLDSDTPPDAANDYNFIASSYKDVYSKVHNIEKKQISMTSKIEKDLQGLTGRMLGIENQASDALVGLTKTIGIISSKIEEGEESVDIFKNDINEVSASLQELFTKLNNVGEKVKGK
eukprot:TRINITY_DN15_c0_g2_i2.p1 TRINITY_DN15_c0_g2~~TRINITY_DN15_c0_g2_i2.p1  ORF type:complete len:388 (+),score=59.75 TRINITY_DN15_c0_g2_i2:23-1186(+)